MLRVFNCRVSVPRLLAMALAVGCMTPALAAVEKAAGEKKAPNPERMFARRDANRDGSLTLAEFRTGMKDKALDRADRRFQKLDANGDGKVTLEEFKAGIPARKA